MFRLFGVLPASEETAISARVAAALLHDKSYQWLENGAVMGALDEHLKANRIRANANTRRGIYRLLSQKLSKRLLEECAVGHSANLTSGRLRKATQFLVHEQMSPWVLIYEHAGHLRHPEKNWEFWHSRPHREWVDLMLDTDSLVPDLIEAFEEAFADWIEAGYIERLSESTVPVRSILYEVHAKEAAV